MTNYYFVASALPALQIDLPPELEFQDFEDLLKDNLTEADLAKVWIMRFYYDIQNMRAWWKNEALDPIGNLNEVELEEALVAKEGLPDYVQDFLENYTNTESRLHHFSALPVAYFATESKRATGFLQRYLSFEREWRLVMTAFRAKQLGRDFTSEFQFEDPDDDFVAQILAQKDAKTYTPPDEYEELKPLFEAHRNDPLGLHLALCEYRFNKIQEMFGVKVFSIDRILAYMARLIIVEKWQLLNKEKGVALANKILGVN
jgi:hypothetical protein